MRIRGQSRRNWDNDKVRPVVPWSKRNMGTPKNNGWAWIGEGSEQKVYHNVILSFKVNPIKRLALGVCSEFTEGILC